MEATMNDVKIFDIEDFKKNMKQSYSISASAGTGKTYNMVQIVKALKENEISIDQILIVTYTEKAAGELKDRIKEEIPDVDIDKAHIGTIHSFCKETISEFYKTMKLPSELSIVDDAKMEGLYSDFIRKQLYSGNLDLEQLKGSNMNYIMDIAKFLYLDRNGQMDSSIVDMNPFSIFCNDLSNRLKALGGLTPMDVEAFFMGCATLTEDPILQPYYEKLAKEFNYIVNQAKPFYQAKEADLKTQASTFDAEWTALKQTLSQLKKDAKKDPSLKQSVEDLEAQVKEKKKQRDDANKEAEKKLKIATEDVDKLKQFIIDSVINKGELDYNAGTVRFVANDSNLDLIRRIKNEKIDAITMYVSYAVLLYQAWQKHKKRNKLLSFNDMLREVRECVVNNGPLISKLREKYTYALIDEFQDTNQLQWDVFKNVFLDDVEHKHYVIVVGDRKQSIYSFQGADLTVYDNAVKEITKPGVGTSCYLPKNYRSTDSLIAGYNQLFSMDSFKSLEYTNPVGVGRLDQKTLYMGKEIKGLGIVVKKEEAAVDAEALDDEGNAPQMKQVSATVSPFEYAQKCVELMIDFCSKDENGNTKLTLVDKNGIHNVSFKNFMVLARSRSELSAFEYELRKVGIPYVKYKDDKLFRGIECAQWIALVNAILKPDFTGRNRNAFRKALFTKFFGRKLSEIASTYYDRDDIPEMELMRRWKALAGEYKYEELMDSIIVDSRIEERMGTLTDIQALNVFKQIGDYALGYLLEGHTLFELKTNLTNLSMGDKDEDSGDGAIVAKGTDYDCVELMTIHASKGLDRSIVFVPGGEKKDNKKSSPAGIYHDVATSKAYLTLDRDKKKKELNQEKDRLFYVAYTRARNLMVLPYFDDNQDVTAIHSIKELISKPENSSYYHEYVYDGPKATDTLKKEVSKILGSTANTAGKEEQEAVLKKLSRDIPKHNSYKHSYASMSKIKDDKALMDEALNPNKEGEELQEALSGIDLNAKVAEIQYEDSEPFAIPTGFPKGAAVGTTLHEVFENVEFTNVDSNLSEVVEKRFKANRLSLSEDHKIYVEGMVRNVLTANLPVIHGSNTQTGLEDFKLNSLASESRKAEAEFNFSELDSGAYSNYFNGFIDLLFKRGEYYSILDWKSDTMNDKDLLSYKNAKDIKTRVDGHYSIQRVLYSYCLVKWLYDLGVEKTLEEVFEKHFGGIYYVFIRGCKENTSNGIYAQTWDSFETLEREFNSIMFKVKTGGIQGGGKNE